jgi:hypothetical protein
LLTYYLLGAWDLASFKNFVCSDLHGTVVVHDRYVDYGASPKVLICVRDSLLVSNKGLRDFLDDAGRDLVHHQLTAWQGPSVATYVRRRLVPGAVSANRERNR